MQNQASSVPIAQGRFRYSKTNGWTLATIFSIWKIWYRFCITFIRSTNYLSNKTNGWTLRMIFSIWKSVGTYFKYICSRLYSFWHLIPFGHHRKIKLAANFTNNLKIQIKHLTLYIFLKMCPIFSALLIIMVGTNVDIYFLSVV